MRCAGHDLNLVAKAILFGRDIDAFGSELQNLSVEEQDLRRWRKKGLTGRLHNIIILSSTLRHSRSASKLSKISSAKVQLTGPMAPSSSSSKTISPGKIPPAIVPSVQSTSVHPLMILLRSSATTGSVIRGAPGPGATRSDMPGARNLQSCKTNSRLTTGV